MPGPCIVRPTFWWINMCARVSIYMQGCTTQHTWSTLYNPKCKGAQQKLITHYTTPQGWTLQFFVHFQVFSRLKMPWNLGWIFPNLYFLQKPSKNHWSSFFKSLLRTIDLHSSNPFILHVVSCFGELCDLTTKRLKKLWSCMIRDERELQRLEWKQ